MNAVSGEIDEPTAEQCTARERIGDGYACWYPQMGGYVGKAVVVPGEGCADVYVWHDGLFPFGEGENPAVIHHCSGQQFVDFGNFLITVTREA